jgi:hypothetical protein
MSRKRGLLVWSLLVLATTLLFVSSLTVWLFARVDVKAQLRERLPKRWQGTAPARTAALQNTVGPATADRLLRRPRAQTLRENIKQHAHAAVAKLLEGEHLGKNGNISTANGEVTLDLRPAITRLPRASGWRTN